MFWFVPSFVVSVIWQGSDNELLMIKETRKDNNERRSAKVISFLSFDNLSHLRKK
jgi:hypothetical protein